MSEFITFKPIGEVLKEAGLLSSPQIEIALRDQKYHRNLRFGEILALRGWIKQDTVDFFVREWPKLVNHKMEHPIGFYLKKANLITEKDIKAILVEQHKHSLYFGDTAIKKGLVKPHTIDFFLKNLFPTQEKKNENKIKFKNSIDKITEDDLTYWVIMDDVKTTRF